MSIATLIPWLVSLAAPNAPSWVSTLIAASLPLVWEVVDELMDVDLSGPEKFIYAAQEVAGVLDEGLDGIPEWADLDEAARDRIIWGLVELTVFVQRLAAKGGSKSARRSIRRAVRHLRKD